MFEAEAKERQRESRIKGEKTSGRGHGRHPSMTMRYAHLAPGHLVNTAAAIDSRVATYWPSDPPATSDASLTYTG